MIDKMSTGANQPIRNQSIGSQSISAGHSDKPRSLNSPASSLTGAIDHMVKQGMPIDVQHITAIRTAIADGQYPVDSTAIADAMIEFDRSGGGFL